MGPLGQSQWGVSATHSQLGSLQPPIQLAVGIPLSPQQYKWVLCLYVLLSSPFQLEYSEPRILDIRDSKTLGVGLGSPRVLSVLPAEKGSPWTPEKGGSIPSPLLGAPVAGLEPTLASREWYSPSGAQPSFVPGTRFQNTRVFSPCQGPCLPLVPVQEAGRAEPQPPLPSVSQVTVSVLLLSASGDFFQAPGVPSPFSKPLPRWHPRRAAVLCTVPSLPGLHPPAANWHQAALS